MSPAEFHKILYILYGLQRDNRQLFVLTYLVAKEQLIVYVPTQSLK